MKKNNSFNDIIPPKSSTATGRRSIRDIPLAEKKQNKIDELLKETADFREEQHEKHEEEMREAPRSIRREPIPVQSSRPFWITAVAMVLVIVIGSLFFFNNATVTISLKTESFPVDVTATSTATSLKAVSTLPYNVLSISKEESLDIAATGALVKMEKKATGTIVIYNNFNSSPQALIAITRFETPEGLIYRLDKATTVPGMSIKDGKSVPGSVEATVTADVSGTKYNIDKSDFTIPGFKGSAKYEGFYARSKTALTGGFSGTMPQVSDADLKGANEDLQRSLTAGIFGDVTTQTPTDSIYFKDGVRTNYSSTVTPTSDGKAKVSGKISAEALIFKRTDIEKIMTPDMKGENYHFDNLDSLILSFENKNPIDSFSSNPILILRFKGVLTTGQSFDPEALKSALAGKSKDQLQQILKMYPEITKAGAVIRPIWSRSFPPKPEKITITVTKVQ